MAKEIDFNSQFSMSYEDYLKGIDFSNWYRYYFIIKAVVNFKPKNILEIGAGNEIVKNCLKNLVKDYKVMDINSKLNPDILSDLREFKSELKEKFDCLICADVLEHIPFSDFKTSLTNIYKYLTYNGKALITIPHKRSHFLFITPWYKPYLLTLPTTGFGSRKAFYARFIKKKILIDPHHCWEIGNGNIKKTEVEAVVRKVGFRIDKFAKLLYVDFWVLSKK